MGQGNRMIKFFETWRIPTEKNGIVLLHHAIFWSTITKGSLKRSKKVRDCNSCLYSLAQNCAYAGWFRPLFLLYVHLTLPYFEDTPSKTVFIFTLSPFWSIWTVRHISCSGGVTVSFKVGEFLTFSSYYRSIHSNLFLLPTFPYRTIQFWRAEKSVAL